MKLLHVAMYVSDLEKCRKFYEKYFDAVSNDLYHSTNSKMDTYILSFKDGGAIEIMQRHSSDDNVKRSGNMGLIHFAVSVGSEERVDSLTKEIMDDGYIVFSQPRRTGDGYYESVVLDPDGARVEITV